MIPKKNSPYIADWLAISLRWFMLVSLTFALGFNAKLNLSATFLLAFIILLNLSLTALAGLRMKMTYYRLASVGLDLLVAGALYWMQDGLRGSIYWVALLPVLSAAIYYEIVGGILAAVVFSAWIGLLEWQAQSDLIFVSLAIAFLVIFSLVCGFLSRAITANMNAGRQGRKSADEKKISSQSALQTERMRAIYELTLALSSSLSYTRVLESALDASASALNADPTQAQGDPLVSAVLLFKDEKLTVGSARHFTNADMRATFDAEEGILKNALDESDATYFSDIENDPELNQIVAFRNCKSGYCFPLRSGFNIYGALLFAHPDPKYFTPERSGLLEIIGRQSVIAIQNARLYQDLVEEKERMVEVQEEARKKLARDLHDGPTQSVAAMAMRLNIIKRMLTKDVNAASDEITKLEELAQRTSKEIRHMLFTLRPLILESQGLGAAVQSMADKMLETYEQKVSVNIDEKITAQLEMGKQGVIFYIIEEAVNNARKHAAADVIAVRLRSVETGIALLEIIDDGAGFDIKAMTQDYLKRANSSLGMVNLRERAELVGGALQMDSAVGKGTKVQVYIPLNEEAADRMRQIQK